MGLRRTLTLVLVACALVHRSPARAAAPGDAATLAEGASLQELLLLALEKNPAIRAAALGLEAERGRSRMETAWPDPTLMATYLPRDRDDDLPPRWELMLTQQLPPPGRTASAARLRRAEEFRARLEYERTVRDVVLSVRESALELRYLRRARGSAAGNLELLHRLRAAGEAAFSRDRAGLIDVLRAQSQEAQARFDLELLAELERTETVRLNSLLSRPPDAPVGPLRIEDEPLAVGVGEVLAHAADSGDEVRLARAGRAIAAAERTLAARESLPEFVLGAGYEREEDGGGAMDRWKVQLGMSLPVQLGRVAGRLGSARAGLESSEARVRGARDAARAGAQEAWFRFRNAERLVLLYRETLLPQAEAALAQAEAAYRDGSASFSDLVEIAALRYTFETALERALADRGRAVARLEAATGRVLTRRTEPPGEAGP